jgi:hypothetical protein
VGEPSQEHQIRRQLIMKHFIPKGANELVARCLLDLLARGNLANNTRFEIWVQPGVQFDEVLLKQRVAEGISRAFTFRRWRVYMREKWDGADEACCAVVLPLLIHELLIDAYDEFCKAHASKKQTARPRLGVDAEAAVGAGAGDRLDIVPHGGHGSDAGGAPGEAPTAANNDKFRRTAAEFLHSTSPGPVGQTVCLRMILTIVQTMQKEEFWVGSKKWN